MSPLFAVVDLETTGGMLKRDSIIEVAIALYDGSSIIQEFESLVRPAQSIPPFITQLTGITNEMVEDAPYFYEIAKEIVEITEGAIFVAHNVGFDYGFLRRAFQDLGFTYTRKRLCTAKLARRLIPELKRHNLDRLIDHFKICVQNRHRAMDDVKATVVVLDQLLQKKDSEKTLKEFVHFGTKLSQIPEALSLEELHSLPEAAGVYFLYGANEHLLYVGKSIDIKHRIFQHFRSHSTKSMKFLAQVVKIDFELTGSEMIALIKEDLYIKELRPAYNSAQRKKNYKYAIIASDEQLLPIIKPFSRLTGEESVLAQHTYKHQAKKHLSSTLINLGLCQCQLFGLLQFESCELDGTNSCIKMDLDNNTAINEIKKQIHDTFKYTFEHDMVLIDQGRESDEKSLVFIINGEVSGFGYLPAAESIKNMEEFDEYLQPVRPQVQYNKFVKRVMGSSKHLKQILR